MYDERNDNNMRQKDLVLAPNEYCFLQNKTNGVIKTYTGPIMLTISQQESLVIFDTKSKQFKEVQNFDQAKQTFVSAPENWYVILKNPAVGGVYPEKGKPVVDPGLEVGRKINVRGPVSFSLFPGQMTKVIRGHALRSNQYLLARVYEADAASTNKGEILDAEGKVVEKENTYVNGQILVIKGTEVSFYIPPTGIEVIPVDNDPDKGYVREAITLERLEYCILKDEDGNKRYVHGPEVVFPEPTETFVTSPKKGYIFRAMELSPISGIYVKVIAEYKDNEGTPDEVVHPVGEELFITGNDQMIYYPRPEHAIINYDDKLMHHAIAIPKGEGRYIMNRLSGEINTITGPKMYLPDPRTEVVVRRKLTENQCRLWYPGNAAALEYNLGLTEKKVEKSVALNMDDLFAYMTGNTDTTLANLEAKANISRGTSYTKPRTITLDNKFEGVVSIDIWTGYAVNVISKNGDRKVVCGPQTVLLDYDQTLEVLNLSTGKPKTTDHMISTVFLRHENNKVSDFIDFETKDFVKGRVKVSYCVNFDADKKDKWFSVENYVKYLCDRERALIKRKAKEYTIEDFYMNYGDIVRSVAIDERPDNANGRYFEENGMIVCDCEVLGINVEQDIEDMLIDHQHDVVRKNLELASAQKEAEVAAAMAITEEAQQKLRSQQVMNKLKLQEEEAAKKLELQAIINRKNEEEAKIAKEAELNLQPVIDQIAEAAEARKTAAHQANLAREAEEHKMLVEHETNMNAINAEKERTLASIEAGKQRAYAETIEKVMSSITPDLIAALETGGKCDLMATLAEAMSPYAIANGEGVVDATQRLLHGMPFEDILETLKPKQ